MSRSSPASALELSRLNTAEVLSLYQRKTLSPVDVTSALLTRIEALQPGFNAYRHIDREGALAAARASETRWLKRKPLGLLDGVPVSFKDLLHVQGWPTRKGSLATSSQCQPEDSPVAARLRESGAVLVGKTQTAEYGWRGLTESSLAGITRNAWNPDYASGGSSGGAAVAAALGLGLQIGTDGGGSIRQPAAVNGVFGFKPSYGRVAGYPAALNGNLFHIGPLTRNVSDAALLLSVIAQPDVRDWTSLPNNIDDWGKGLDNPRPNLKDVRIAYSRSLFNISVDPEVALLVERAVAKLKAHGAQIEEVDSGIENPAAILNVLVAERGARLQREIGEKGLELVSADIRAAVEQGRKVSVADVVGAQEQRAALAVQWRRFHQRYDLLLTPVQSQPVPLVGTVPQAPFLSVFNLTQQPAASVPVGVDSRGLPVALQIVGPPLGDLLVLRAARVYELLQPFAITPHAV